MQLPILLRRPWCQRIEEKRYLLGSASTIFVVRVTTSVACIILAVVFSLMLSWFTLNSAKIYTIEIGTIESNPANHQREKDCENNAWYTFHKVGCGPWKHKRPQQIKSTFKVRNYSIKIVRSRKTEESLDGKWQRRGTWFQLASYTYRRRRGRGGSCLRSYDYAGYVIWKRSNHSQGWWL